MSEFFALSTERERNFGNTSLARSGHKSTEDVDEEVRTADRGHFRRQSEIPDCAVDAGCRGGCGPENKKP